MGGGLTALIREAPLALFLSLSLSLLSLCVCVCQELFYSGSVAVYIGI